LGSVSSGQLYSQPWVSLHGNSGNFIQFLLSEMNSFLEEGEAGVPVESFCYVGLELVFLLKEAGNRSLVSAPQ
jgi:hypothetical protein